MDIVKAIVSRCPVCSNELAVSRLSCAACNTRIETELPLPPLLRLPAELQEFILVFLRCRGSIRDVEKVLGISYPTVCKRLDLVNELLGQKAPAINGKSIDRGDILARLERGEINAKAAAGLLKGKVKP